MSTCLLALSEPPLYPSLGAPLHLGMHALGEQPRRPEIGRQHGGGRSPSCRQLAALAAATLAECIAPRLSLDVALTIDLCRWLEKGGLDTC
eukprot:6644767-Prymnesium_polylepis.2